MITMVGFNLASYVVDDTVIGTVIGSRFLTQHGENCQLLVGNKNRTVCKFHNNVMWCMR